MEPITREEYYLAKIAGTYKGKTPEPVTIDEYYLATMAGDYSGNTPQPVTRLQYYMAKVAGVWDGSIPAPVTRLEYYWAAIANGEGEVFPPVTREEHFLTLVADAYSVVLTVVTGNPALLEGVKGNRFTSFTLHGKSTQVSTTGAQLFPPPSLGSVEKNGITLDYMEDGKIHIRGTAEITTDFYVSRLQLSAATYTLSVGVNIDTRVLRVALCTDMGIPYLDITEDSLYTTGTIESAMDVSLLIRVYAGKSIDLTVQPMLNIGSAALPYEPYTGGKPSPSPQYPQEIKSVGQDGEIGVSVDGGNLIKAPFESRENSYKPGYTFTQNGITFTVQNDMGIKVAGTNTSADKVAQFSAYYQGDDEKPKYPAGTYTISEWATVQIKLASEVINKNGTFTANEEFNVNGFYIAIPAGQSVNKTIYPMLNIGSTALPYEPYKPAQTLIVPTPNGLPGIPVSSGGNYTDEKGQQWVADEIDLARGERVKWIGEYELTGKESVADFGLRPRVRMVSITIPDAYIDAENHGILKAVMSNKYKQVSFNEVGNNINLIARGQQRNICISIPTDIGIEDFKTDLSNQYASGHPVKVFYKLATPIRTPLPPETIAAYKALRTYSPTTTVINDACAGMSVGYAKMK